jgi:Ras-related C3 botulinum toxin substrate 1
MAQAEDRKKVADWANEQEWADLIMDDQVYTTLVKLRAHLSTHADDGTDSRIKLVVVGDGAVGKTSMLISYAKGSFPETYVPTVFENYTATINYKEKKILLHLWDTAGQEDYDRLRPLSYPGSDIVLLCFSLVTEASYNSIKEKWYPEVDHYVKDVPTILVGTKVDLREAKAPDPGTGEFKPVSTEMGQKLAKEIGAERYIEVSAKTNANLQELFQQAVETVSMSKKQTDNDDHTKEDDEPNIVVVNRTVKPKKPRGACVIL